MTAAPKAAEPPIAAADETAAVLLLLAAGASCRYGGIKQLADFAGEALVHRTARIALASGARVLVITGANAGLVTAALADLPLAAVEHPAWREGMGSSIAAGIGQLQARYPQASGALLCLADQPLYEGIWLAELLAAHRRSPGSIIATQNGGMPGPPVLFPRDLFAELARWSGPKGPQALLQREAHRVIQVVSPAGVDVDTPDDLQRALEILASARPD